LSKDSDTPKTIPDFIRFYYDVFKPVYSHMQIIREPPLEMFFEMNAALDHLAGYWEYGVDEEKAVYAASGHLKRGCFDAFKLVVSEVRTHYNELCKVNTSVINNGEFDKGMIKLWNEIKLESAEARKAEGESRKLDTWHHAFDKWYNVYQKCEKFEREYYLSEHVSWAKKTQRKENWSRRFEGFVVGILSTYACQAATICKHIVSFIKSFWT
jgi:hypothetical protein